MTLPATNSKGCNVCQKKGFPIFLTRFALGTDAAPHAAIPVPAGYPAFTTPDAFYTLRVLRGGYVYVYDSLDHSLKCFIVAADGSGAMAEHDLKLPKPAEKNNLDKACVHIPERMGNAMLVTVPHPEQKRKICIAYTEHLWTPKTCQQHIKSAKVRNHMIEVEVGGVSKQTLPIAQLGSAICEYKMDAKQASCISDWTSTPYLSWNHPAQTAVIAASEKLAPHKGVILGLNDPVGLLADIDSLILYKNKHFEDAHKESLAPYKIIDSIRTSVKTDAENSVKLRWYHSRADVTDFNPYTAAYSQGMAPVHVLRTIPEEDLPPLSPAEQKTQQSQIADEQESAWDHYHNAYNEKKADDWFKITYTPAKEKFANEKLVPLANTHVAWLKTDILGDIMQYTFDGVHTKSGIDYTLAVQKMLGQTQLLKSCNDLYFMMMMGSASDLKNYVLRGLLFNQYDVISDVKANADGFNLNDSKEFAWAPFIAGVGQKLDENALESAKELEHFVQSISSSMSTALTKVNKGQAQSQEFILALAAHTRKAFVQVTYSDTTVQIAKDLTKKIQETAMRAGTKISKAEIDQAVRIRLVDMQASGIPLKKRITTKVTLMLDIEELSKVDLQKSNAARSAQMAAAIKTTQNIKDIALRDWTDHEKGKMKGGIGIAGAGLVFQMVATYALWDDMTKAKGAEAVKARWKFGAGLMANFGIIADEMSRQLEARSLTALEKTAAKEFAAGVSKLSARILLGCAGLIFAVFDFKEGLEQGELGNRHRAFFFYASAGLGAASTLILLFTAWTGVGILLVVALIAVGFLISYFKRNALQDWMSRVVWGVAHKKEKYKSFDIEMNAYHDAMTEMQAG
jgi:hypothetical protein